MTCRIAPRRTSPAIAGSSGERWERYVENFVAMVELGCMRILLNRL